MKLLDGPTTPRFPLSLIHPLGPLFRHLPLIVRRHLLYLRAKSRWGNFRNPTRWSEKIQWRILNDRRALLTPTCDKLAASKYASSVPQAKSPHIKFPETYWVGSSVHELAALEGSLPARWIFKPNHSSGRIADIDVTRRAIDWSALNELGRRWLQRDEELLVFGHWAYGAARPLLIAQERIGHAEVAPADLRLVCNRGEITMAFWTDGYQTENYRLYAYDADLRTRARFDHPYEAPLNEPGPDRLLSDEAVRAIAAFAREVSAPFDFIRIDGVVVDDAFHFLEFTTYPTSGLGVLGVGAELRLGSAWHLPDLNAPDPREAEWRALLQGTPKGTLQP
jgi:hypothetical protein